MPRLYTTYALFLGALCIYCASCTISFLGSDQQDPLLDVRTLLSSSLGAITTLVKSNREYERLKSRNLSIQKYLSNHTEFKFDVIIFHEDVMPVAHIADLQAATPDLPLIFARIDELFFRPNRWNTFGFCKANPGTKMFGLGYKRMCRFWLMDFYKLLRSYSWMMRWVRYCIQYIYFVLLKYSFVGWILIVSFLSLCRHTLE